MSRSDDRRARQRRPRRTRNARKPAGATASGGATAPISDGAPRAAHAEPGLPGPRSAASRPASGSASASGAARNAPRWAARDPRGAKGTARTSRIRRLFTWKKLLGSAFGLVVLAVGAFAALYMAVDVPSGNAAAKAQSNVYRYSDGTVFARTGDINRESVKLSRVPKDVQRAFVAAENKNFYSDSGVDLKGTTRGIVNTVLGRGKQGGSTITQQYVKNYYLTQEQTVSRKVKELVIALKVDRQKSKDDILEGYLNTSYYGRNAYGIQAAARAYYGKEVERLTVAEGAYLASLLQAPSQYDWAAAGPVGKKLVTRRWNYVLDNMVGEKWLDGDRRAAMKFPVPRAPKAIAGHAGQRGYLVKLAERELVRAGVSEQDLLAAGGWDITLNIDRNKQRSLERAVDSELLADLNPKARPVDARVQAGAVSVDPKTGGIVALYGGRDYVRHYVNNATRRDYQPASTFKPLILAAALENDSRTREGLPIRPGTVYDGTSKRPIRGSATPFAPPNEDGRSYGPITVQQAMNKSVNSVFAQMAVDVGLGDVKRTAVDLGMNPKAGGFDEGPAMSLGVMGASPLDMAGVYATLDNHGKRVTPTIVKSAQKRDEQADLPEPLGEQVVSRGTADSVTSVLTGVVDDGTGSAVRTEGQAVAGKTGTSDDNKSAWFVGYTPDLVTAVGLFGEADRSHGTVRQGEQVSLRGAGGGGRVNGGAYPAHIWAAYTQAALRGQDPSTFDLDATDTGPTAPATRAPSAPPRTVAPEPDPTTSEPTPDPSTTSPTPTPTPTPTTPTPPPTPTPTAPTPTPTPTAPTPTPTPTPTDEGPPPTLPGRPDPARPPGG
ncbi:transglycosylase domain-containing protein [Streptomyces sp. NPDC057702]|uniref:transglycosylase domain-containing protein n=1 Tax=unclassified Streptomyces TaxID=2593676 RepID=UPI0036AFA215